MQNPKSQPVPLSQIDHELPPEMQFEALTFQSKDGEPTIPRLLDDEGQATFAGELASKALSSLGSEGLSSKEQANIAKPLGSLMLSANRKSVRELLSSLDSDERIVAISGLHRLKSYHKAEQPHKTQAVAYPSPTEVKKPTKKQKEQPSETTKLLDRLSNPSKKTDPLVITTKFFEKRISSVMSPKDLFDDIVNIEQYIGTEMTGEAISLASVRAIDKKARQKLPDSASVSKNLKKSIYAWGTLAANMINDPDIIDTDDRFFQLALQQLSTRQQLFALGASKKEHNSIPAIHQTLLDIIQENWTMAQNASQKGSLILQVATANFAIASDECADYTKKTLFKKAENSNLHGKIWMNHMSKVGPDKIRAVIDTKSPFLA